MIDNTHLEPAEVDPKKLRRTALILVVIMVVGGILVFTAYNKMAAEQSQQNRPAMIHKIRKEKDLAVLLQDGTTKELFSLRGNVVAIHCVNTVDPEMGSRSMEVMKRLAASAVETPDLRLVTLVLNPPRAEDKGEQITSFASAQGMKLPQWWVATTEAETLHEFIRKQLKASTYPHLEEGRWQFDTSIFLIDQEGHLRRAVVPQKRGGQPYVATFDFDQAAEWDSKGIKTGTEFNNQEQLERLLRETIDILRKEPTQTP